MEFTDFEKTCIEIIRKNSDDMYLFYHLKGGNLRNFLTKDEILDFAKKHEKQIFEQLQYSESITPAEMLSFDNIIIDIACSGFCQCCTNIYNNVFELDSDSTEITKDYFAKLDIIAKAIKKAA